MENLASVVGRNLSILRKSKGMTQQELAQEINYSDKSISKWELGYALPSVDVLKDFAQFYGVSIDYLVSEQTEENLQSVGANTTVDAKVKRANQIIVIAMTVTFVFLVAVCVFFSGYYNPFKIRPEGTPAHKGLWVIFVWMVPVSFALVAAECWHYYHNRLLHVILCSAFMWTLLLSFCVQFQYYNEEPEVLWYILVVGIPIQIILILWGNFRPKRKDHPTA